MNYIMYTFISCTTIAAAFSNYRLKFTGATIFKAIGKYFKTFWCTVNNLKRLQSFRRALMDFVEKK